MQNLQILEVKGQRVLTTQQIADCYGTTRKVVQNNFAYNRCRYVAGKHYIPLEKDDLINFKAHHEIQGNLKYAHILYLWTEKGALLHAKSLNTDKAWEVYDYLVDFYFRSHEKLEKKEVVPVKVKTEPLKDEFEVMGGKAEQDAISIFKILMRVAEMKGLTVKSKALSMYKSHLRGDRIAVRSGLPLESVNYEIAFELFHAVVNYDKGDMLNTPLAEYYNSQAERAATLIIMLLNTQIV